MTEQRDFTITLFVDNTPKEIFDAINNVRALWSGENEGRTDKLGEFRHRDGEMHRCTIRSPNLFQARGYVGTLWTTTSTS